MLNERSFDKCTFSQGSVRLFLSLHVEFVELMNSFGMMMACEFFSYDPIWYVGASNIVET